MFSGESSLQPFSCYPVKVGVFHTGEVIVQAHPGVLAAMCGVARVRYARIPLQGTRVTPSHYLLSHKSNTNGRVQSAEKWSKGFR